MAATQAATGNQARGIAIAVVAHVLIIGLLSVQWTAGERRFDNPPMEVDLIAETAPVSTAPVISDTPPAPRLGEEDSLDDAPPEPLPTPPLPEPVVRPTPAPAPKVVKKAPPVPPKKAPPPAAQKATPKTPTKVPTKTGTRGPTGRLDGITDGLGKEATKKPAAAGAPAAATAAEVRKSIDVSIKAKVKPYWDRCKVSGVDIDQLVTVVRFRLTQSGKLSGFTSVDTTGENDSNRFQVQRHQECAKRAVELAAPSFDLDPEYYSEWQNRKLEFFKR
jgi:outer membrane biosynthesis protein TonB